MDFFNARYFSSGTGRFISPDPYMGSMNQSNPQSLNRYSYVLNNPLNLVDPTGLDCVYFNNSGTGLDDTTDPIDHDSNASECGKSGGAWVEGYTDSSLIAQAKNGTWNIGSYTSDTAYFTNVVVPNPSAGFFSRFFGGACTGGISCQTDSSSSNIASLSEQLSPTGGTVLGLLQWAVQQTTPVSKTANSTYGNGSNWCGPGGSGVPGFSGWECMAHDYNYKLSGNSWVGHNNDPNHQFDGGPQLRRINQELCDHAPNPLVGSFFAEPYSPVTGGSDWGCR